VGSTTNQLLYTCNYWTPQHLSHFLLLFSLLPLRFRFPKTANTIFISSLFLSFNSPWLQTLTEMALKEEAPNSIVLSSLVPAVPLLHRDPDFAALTPPHETTLVSSSTFSISPKPKNEINKCVRVCICDNVALNYDYDAIMKLTICR
jgi:hypothetical protein